LGNASSAISAGSPSFTEAILPSETSASTTSEAKFTSSTIPPALL